MHQTTITTRHIMARRPCACLSALLLIAQAKLLTEGVGELIAAKMDAHAKLIAEDKRSSLMRSETRARGQDWESLTDAPTAVDSATLMEKFNIKQPENPLAATS